MTGAAGFIGMHTVLRLLDRGDEVIGVDNLNDYYAVSLKEARLARLQGLRGYRHCTLDIAARVGLRALFDETRPQRVIHLAAQVGVRHSVRNPHAFVDSNLAGFVNVLEGCRHLGIEHLVYASSSTVYGGNEKMPFSEHDGVDHPGSLYAATKKANELIAHTYGHLYGLPTTGLRFFMVYGPWGRPDMAYYLFTRSILEGSPIDVFNHGRMLRDFTYIDDIVEGLTCVLEKRPTPGPAVSGQRRDPSRSDAPYRVFNIGSSRPIELLDFIDVLEHALGRKARKNLLAMQQGDVPATYADTTELDAWVGFKPATSITDGIQRCVDWYVRFHKVDR
ncbi:MAG TPA: NAD-dependent epimerase [Gemmatimonadaceae bacterium]|nr:NAD-dependent epimerase [Gemmatimonadaceae bacterium]